MDGKSLNIIKEKLDKLKEIIPEAFTENKIDWEKLKAALGEDIEFKNERYVLNWAGKSDAFKVLQSPTTATLIPCKEESVNFNSMDSTGSPTTENIFIEGENLEVLKVLQKSYFGEIKMIYIDPPYNTGNDNFIYPDKFSETKEEYLSRIGDKDETGYMTREGLFHKNSKDSGHYHSNWLSMMYPRLFLARNLLRDDGVIFVSIDDNEVHNLRLLMNEVFGEENFVGIIAINSSPSAIDYGHLGKMHDYAIFYAKNLEDTITVKLEDENKEFKYTDEIGSFNLYPLYNGNVAFNPNTRPNLYYPFYLNPNKIINKDFYEISLDEKKGWMQVYPVISKKDGIQRVWRWGREKSRSQLNKEIIGYKNEDEEYRIVQKTRLTGKVIRSMQTDKDVSSRRGTAEVESIFARKIFNFPKPVELIKRFISISTQDNDIILDFFSGSCTTAHAVLDLNKEDGGSRKFICVQLAEKCDENSEGYKAGYKTIAEIGKERIRRVIKKIKEEQNGKLDFDGTLEKQDLGFKVFKLSESNFKIWHPKIENEEQLLKQLALHLDPVNENAEFDNIMYELLSKSGVSLTAKIEIMDATHSTSSVTTSSPTKDNYYWVNNGEIALILEKVNENIIKTVISEKPQKVLTLDRLFKNNDQLKTNTALQMKDAGIEFKVV